MIRVAVVEDTDEEFNVFEAHLNKYSLLRETEIRITRFRSAESALEAKSSDYDILFLDIALPGASGMELAESIRRVDSEVPIIFVTNLAQFAIKGYEVNAFDFIVKPVKYPDLEFKLDRLLHRLKTKAEPKIFVKTGNQHIALPASEIRYIEIQGHVIVYHTIHGDYESYGVLREVEAKLNGYGFEKCNACFLVNLRYVDSVVGYDLYIGETRLAISHPRRKDFVKALNKYFGEGGAS